MNSDNERYVKFRAALLEAMERHGLKSYRDASRCTGLHHSTIGDALRSGRIPARSWVIRWAEGIEEDVDEWLALAGYRPISKDKPPLEVPESVREAIQNASSEEEQIRLAFDYILDTWKIKDAFDTSTSADYQLGVVHFFQATKRVKLLPSKSQRKDHVKAD